MTWYQSGTVAVTQGSPIITGTGTDFMAPNVFAGDGFVDEAGYTYEVVGAQSSTQLTISPAYRGATGGGRGYKIMPMQDYNRLLAQRAAELIGSFAAVRDGVGQGLFADGSPAAPGVRFSADQDTGIRRAGDNALSIVTGGVDRVVFTAAGVMDLKHTAENAASAIFMRDPSGDLFNLRAVNGIGANTIGSTKARLGLFYGDGTEACAIDFKRGGGSSDGILAFRTLGAERLRMDGDGNLLVGVTSGTSHVITRGTNEGDLILNVSGQAQGSTAFYSGSSNPFSGTASCMKVNRNGTTFRSINSAGTVNASGADYAEYMTKADGCGSIAKGDVCGVDQHGTLTRTWAEAVRYVVKSTDPSLVGGDTWAAHLPARPDAPGEAPLSPVAPDGEADEAALSAYVAALAAYPAAKAAYDAAVANHNTALAAWEVDLEAARQTVDRIAFCGQVPVNVDADTLAACEAALADGVAVYLVAIANGGGIGVAAVREGDMTLPLYMRRVGAVWAIRDGRPWIDVQHG